MAAVASVGVVAAAVKVPCCADLGCWLVALSAARSSCLDVCWGFRVFGIRGVVCMVLHGYRIPTSVLNTWSRGSEADVLLGASYSFCGCGAHQFIAFFRSKSPARVVHA